MTEAMIFMGGALIAVLLYWQNSKPAPHTQKTDALHGMPRGKDFPFAKESMRGNTAIEVLAAGKLDLHAITPHAG